MILRPFVFPVHGMVDGYCTCKDPGGPKCDPGKHPCEKGYPDSASTERRVAEAFARKWPGCNFGLLTGAKSGCVVLDFDSYNAFRDALVKGLPATGPRVRTGRDGFGIQVYFKHPGYKVSGKTKVLPDLDIRGDGNYVLVPGSRHQSGRRYVEIDGHSLAQPLPDAPEWVAALFVSKAKAPGSSGLADVADFHGGIIGETTRNTTIFKLGCRLRAYGADPSAIETVLLAINRLHVRPPLPEATVLKHAESAATFDAGEPDDRYKLSLLRQALEVYQPASMSDKAFSVLVDGHMSRAIYAGGPEYPATVRKLSYSIKTDKSMIQRETEYLRDKRTPPLLLPVSYSPVEGSIYRLNIPALIATLPRLPLTGKQPSLNLFGEELTYGHTVGLGGSRACSLLYVSLLRHLHGLRVPRRLFKALADGKLHTPAELVRDIDGTPRTTKTVLRRLTHMESLGLVQHAPGGWRLVEGVGAAVEHARRTWIPPGQTETVLNACQRRENESRKEVEQWKGRRKEFRPRQAETPDLPFPTGIVDLLDE